MEVQITRGTVVLRKPTAGERNKAMMLAERSDDTFNKTIFITELLPLCITSHPFGAQPLKDALDGLDIDDYDKLVEAIKDTVGFKEVKGDIIKKSGQP